MNRQHRRTVLSRRGFLQGAAAAGTGGGLLAACGGIVLGVAQALGNQVDVRYDLLSGVLFGHLLFLAVLAFRPQGLFGRQGRA
jgi:branched-subunit amino acid ABC-type transport system permease component